jgi:hypothetical protein
VSEEPKFIIQDEVQQQQEDNLPIDINYEKVSDWLIDRNYMPDDFFEQLKQIRILMKTALQETREQRNENLKKAENVDNEKLISEFFEDLKKEAVELKEEEDNVLNHYWARKITDLLEKVDAAQGGGYLFGLVGGSKRLKLWRSIVTLYEKQNLYLGEMASKMLSNVKYDM